MWFCPFCHLVGASPLLLDVRYLFLVGSNILQPMVVQQGVAVSEFSQKMSIYCSNPPSWIDPWSIGPRYDQWSLNNITNFILTIPTIIKKKKKKKDCLISSLLQDRSLFFILPKLHPVVASALHWLNFFLCGKNPIHHWQPASLWIAPLELLLFVVVQFAQACPTLVTPWTVVCQGPLSMGFPRQEYWSSLPFPTPGDIPNSGIKPMSPTSLLHCRQILYHQATVSKSATPRDWVT